jgi:hypothetical protein
VQLDRGFDTRVVEDDQLLPGEDDADDYEASVHVDALLARQPEPVERQLLVA